MTNSASTASVTPSPTVPPTGAERYLAGQLADVVYHQAYLAAAAESAVPESGKILERWWSKVVVPTTDPDGCWLWVGGTDKTNTYGVFWDGTKMVPAHHFGYLSVGGATMTPMKPTLDHTCRNTLCVNPNHLVPVSRTTNSRRRSRQGVRRTR